MVRGVESTNPEAASANRSATGVGSLSDTGGTSTDPAKLAELMGTPTSRSWTFEVDARYHWLRGWLLTSVRIQRRPDDQPAVESGSRPSPPESP